MRVKRAKNIISTKTSFENLLQSVETMHIKYKSYLGSNNLATRKTEDEDIETEMTKFQTQFNVIVSNNLRIISDYFVNVSLNFSANEAQQLCAQLLGSIQSEPSINVADEQENGKDFETNFANIICYQDEMKRKQEKQLQEAGSPDPAGLFCDDKKVVCPQCFILISVTMS